MITKDKQLLNAFRTNTPSDLVFWSFRYFLGRMTIATSSFAEDLAKAWPHLDSRVQKLIMRELEEEFERDDRVRQNVAEGKDKSIARLGFPLGMDCDRAAWQRVRDAYKHENKN